MFTEFSSVSHLLHHLISLQPFAVVAEILEFVRIPVNAKKKKKKNIQFIITYEFDFEKKKLKLVRLRKIARTRVRECTFRLIHMWITV